MIYLNSSKIALVDGDLPHQELSSWEAIKRLHSLGYRVCQPFDMTDVQIIPNLLGGEILVSESTSYIVWDAVFALSTSYVGVFG